MTGPPGYPRPARRAILSKASPGASSRVRASGTIDAVLDAHELRVAAGDDEAVEGILDGKRRDAARTEECREQMALEMIDRDERNPAREGESPGRRESDEQRTDQARSRGRRDEVDVFEAHGGQGERLLEDGGKVFEVRPGRDLGHDAAVGGVSLHLGGDDVRAHAAFAVEHRDGRLVARGLDSENVHAGGAGR